MARPSAKELAPGATLDGFRVGERLHQGGMATVWLATRADLSFPVVLKVPRVANGDSSVAIVGFETELLILPRLAGPHVPRLVASGDFEEQPYLALEYVAGTLLERLQAAAPLPAAQVAQIGARVAEALHDLHRQQVVHLDLSPDNVVLRADGAAVLLDFGLSRHRELPDLLAEEFRRPLGTAAWMAPEQVLGARDDHRSDLYALGAILLALVTGRLPFGEPESPRGLRRRLNRDPIPPRAVAGACPPWLQEIILRCLEVDPDARYQSAAQLGHELRHPDQVELTERAARLRRRGFLEQVGRRLSGSLAELTPRLAARPWSPQEAPVVMVAVDVAQGSEPLAEALRLVVRRCCEADAAARLTCVTVHRVVPGMGLNAAEGGRTVHVQRLVELKRWARPLGLPEGRVTFHVLDAIDPAGVLIEYARENRVDHVVIGARGSSALRRHLGSVSARVAAEAPCTVTVVRSPQETAPAPLPLAAESRPGGL